MGDRAKKLDKTIFHPSGEHKTIFGDWNAPGSLVPVPAHDPYKHNRHALPPQPSSWQRFTAWLRYYSIQFRWDVERRLARLLHRRWGDQL